MTSTTALLQLAESHAVRHPEDAAHVLEGCDADDVAELLMQLPSHVAGGVLEELTPEMAGDVLGLLKIDDRRELLENVEPSKAAVVLRALDSGTRRDLLQTLSANMARQLKRLVGYPPDTAGGMMDPQVIALREGMTVEDAIARLRRSRRQALYYLYVVDSERRLIGVLTMRNLLLAEPGTPIDTILQPELVAVPATMDREDVTALMGTRNFLALPVVDSEGALLGIVKHDQVLEAVQEEAFEDIQRMVGAGFDERALSPIRLVVRKRLPWLIVNLATALMAAAVVGLFEETIALVTALAVLLPVVAGQGGNTGAQAMAVVMRGIVLHEIGPTNTRRLLVKEFTAALINGLAIAVICGLAVLAWDGRLVLAGVIVLAMIVNMAAAGLAGASIPLILRAVGLDPAQASSIILTTVTDIIGFFAFLGFAAMFMHQLVPVM